MKTIRAGLHLQKRKFGRSTEETNEIIKTMGLSVEVEGLDFTPLQHRAVHAIQTLLHQTDYDGHESTGEMSIDEFHMTAKMPFLTIKPADFYKAFGCKKRNYNGRNQYSSNEKQQAMDALRSLYEKRYILYYRKEVFFENKEPEERIIKVNMPLIGIAADAYKPIKQSEMLSTIKSNTGERQVKVMTSDKRLEYLKLEISPIFYDQIDSYFIKKPINYLTEIKENYPKASKYVYNFIEYVLTRAAENKGKHIQISKENLAVILRMDGFIKNQKKQKIVDAINQCYSVALRLGYIKSHSTFKGKTIDSVDEIKINYEKLNKFMKIGTPYKGGR
jgi:hypothetical protein